MDFKRYIVDSEQMAKDLSSLIYRIMSPDGVETMYLFDWQNINGTWVILIPLNYECPVYHKADFQTVLNDLATVLNGDLSTDEATRITNELQKDRILLENIIPNGLTQYT